MTVLHEIIVDVGESNNDNKNQKVGESNEITVDVGESDDDDENEKSEISEKELQIEIFAPNHTQMDTPDSIEIEALVLALKATLNESPDILSNEQMGIDYNGNEDNGDKAPTTCSQSDHPGIAWMTSELRSDHPRFARMTRWLCPHHNPVSTPEIKNKKRKRNRKRKDRAPDEEEEDENTQILSEEVRFKKKPKLRCKFCGTKITQIQKSFPVTPILLFCNNTCEKKIEYNKKC
jgi:hypothetical protein